MTGAHSSHDSLYDDFDEVDIFGYTNNKSNKASKWSGSILPTPSCMPSFSSPSKSEKTKIAQQNAHRVVEYNHKPSSSYKSSITSEVSTALDMVFGFNVNRNRSHLPMEIELKQFSPLPKALVAFSPKIQPE